MIEYIGKKLEDVIAFLEKSNEKYVVKDNNHNVCGDTTLVTNIQKQNDYVLITTGEFIFDVKGSNNA